MFLDMTLSRRRGGPQKNKINFLLDFDHQQREHRPWGVNNDDGAKVLLLGEEDFAVVVIIVGLNTADSVAALRARDE